MCGADDWRRGRDIARLNADGSVDLTFNAGRGSGKRIVTQADGTILVGESFAAQRAERNQIARLQSDGSSMRRSTQEPPRFARSNAVQPDGASSLDALTCYGWKCFEPVVCCH